MFRKDFVAIALLLTATQAGAEPLTATQYGDFDRYVLALSWQTGFCQSMHDRNRSEPEECRLQQELPNKADFLTVHGLWPGLPKSIAARGVDDRRWMRFGCATRPVPNMPEVKAGRKCQAAETGLSLEMANKLNSVMPGAGGNSCLERYEYAKHGVCFGFDPDSYFGTMVRLDSEVKQSPLGLFLAKHYGQSVSRDEFDAAVAQGVAMVAQGADLLDIGAESTRPGAKPVETAEAGTATPSDRPARGPEITPGNEPKKD